MHAQRRTLIIAALAAGFALAGGVSASDSRQGPPRTPITAENAAEVVELGVVVASDFPITQVLWLPDDELIALSPDPLGIEAATITPGPLADVFPVTVRVDNRIAVSPDGSHIAALWRMQGDDRFTLHVEAQTNTAPSLETVFVGEPGDVAFSPDGSQIAVGAGPSGDAQLHLFDTETGVETSVLDTAGSVTSIVYSPDGERIITTGELGVQVWSQAADQSWAAENWWPDPPAIVAQVDVSADWVAAASRDGTIQVWDNMATPELAWAGHNRSEVWALAFNPAGDVLAVAGQDGTIRLWETATGDLLHTLEGHAADVRSLSFSADGSLLASSTGFELIGENTVRMWGLPDPRYLGPPEQQTPTQAADGTGDGPGSDGPGQGPGEEGPAGGPGPDEGDGPGSGDYPEEPGGASE